MSNSTKPIVQLPYLGILGLIFITLKLTGHITWSWLWVLAPFWIPIGLALLIFLIVFLFEFFKNR
jgi:hypothetical protein